VTTNRCPVYKRLREARVAAGFSQKQLGIAAGIDEFSASSRVNQYETGKHVPDYLTLKNIGKVIKCPVAYFYTEDDDLAALISSFAKISKSKKLKLIKIINDI
jgi:transcriptional regulator with XRE-family HTH domain